MASNAFVNCDALEDLKGSLLDARSHADALVSAASRLLALGDAENAFAFADRACRLSPYASARNLALRADASWRMGAYAHAETDLTAALKEEPDDLVVNEYILGSDFALKREVAQTVAFDPTANWSQVRSAVQTLLDGGRQIVSQMTLDNAKLAGWAAWRGESDIELHVEHSAGELRLGLSADADHPLASRGISAAYVNASCLGSDLRAIFYYNNTATSDVEIEIKTVSRRQPDLPSRREKIFRRSAEAPDRIWIIVPIYEGAASTIACLNRLEKLEFGSITARVIVIDDCCPDPKLSETVRSLCGNAGFYYFKNRSNLGYAVSVNAGLQTAVEGDVLLLNSDCLLPKTAIGRLMAVAYQHEDIGTVTPLSNSGELTSFPIPYQPNPLPSSENIDLVDRVADHENGRASKTLPTGIGFCLYVKRSVLDLIGFLPTIYGRGYYEDVDFCLQARSLGFRNVCATGIFVGHYGSSSFQTAKGLLVSRNSKRLEAIYRGYRDECVAFVQADPLRVFREKIQQALPLKKTDYLVVSPQRERERGAWWLEVRLPAWLTWSASGEATLHGAQDQAAMRSGSWRAAAGRRAWEKTLIDLAPSRIGIVDPISLPRELSSLLLSMATPMELIVSASPFQPLLDTRCSNCALEELNSGACLTALSSIDNAWMEADTLAAWWRWCDRAERIVTPYGLAKIDEKMQLSAEVARKIVSVFSPPTRLIERRRLTARRCTLGVVVETPTIQIDRFTRALAQKLRAARPHCRLVVLGASVDDLCLLSQPNVFVTGPVGFADYARVCEQYQISALVFAERWVFTDAYEQIHRELPVACFDWTIGAMRAAEGCLTLDPRLCDKCCADLVVDWLSGLIREQERSSRSPN